jgi:hypothetical protein
MATDVTHWGSLTMAIFLPSHKNICLLKSILMGDFEMRSAHASEAIAALIGFRSNISFLSAASHLQDVTIYDVDFVRFENRSVHLGYDRGSSEYLRSIFMEIEWPEPAWKLFKKRDIAGINTWFGECQRRKIPFLHVLQTTKYYSIHWDHISAETSYDNMIQKLATVDLGSHLFRSYELNVANAEPKSLFDGSALVGKVTGLSKFGAIQVANAFASLLFPGNVHSALAA